LSSYDFVIEHIKERENIVTDALSEGRTIRTTQLYIGQLKFSEKLASLVLNKDIQLKMVT
jgi:hypothetical protein